MPRGSFSNQDDMIDNIISKYCNIFEKDFVHFYFIAEYLLFVFFINHFFHCSALVQVRPHLKNDGTS